MFAPAHRRYSGVALDLYFDHCLAREWPHHASVPFDDFIAGTYQRLDRGIIDDRLPPIMHRFTRAMIDDDWLGAFTGFEGVEAALGRLNTAIRGRFGREVDLRPLGDELRRLQRPLADAFAPLFGELKAFVGTRSPFMLQT